MGYGQQVLVVRLDGPNADAFRECYLLHALLDVLRMRYQLFGIPSEQFVLTELINGAPAHSHTDSTLLSQMNRLNWMVSPNLLNEDVQQGSRVRVIVIITKVQITEDVNVYRVHEHAHLLELGLPRHQTLIQQGRHSKDIIHRLLI